MKQPMTVEVRNENGDLFFAAVPRGPTLLSPLRVEFAAACVDAVLGLLDEARRAGDGFKGSLELSEACDGGER